MRLHLDGAVRSIDTGEIRNLFHEVGGDPTRYVKELLRIHATLCPRPVHNGHAPNVIASEGGMS